MRKIPQAGCLFFTMIALSLTAAAEVKIEQEQALMPAKQLVAAAKKVPLAARLSPDGAYMLYAPREAPEDSPLVLRELSTGRETPLPLGRLEREMADVFTRFNFFSSDGRRLILMRPKNDQALPQRPEFELILYDIGKNQATPVPIAGGMFIAHFVFDGQKLVVSPMVGGGVGIQSTWIELGTMQRRPLTLPGWVQSVSPTQNLATVYNRAARPQPATESVTRPSVARSDRRMHFLLWDLSKDQQVAELPTHPRNSALDDIQAIWSGDGRYVAYYDSPEKEGDRWPVTRIWDTTKQKEVALIRDTTPIGPGPAGTDFILTSLGEGPANILVHDASVNRTTTLSDGAKQLVHAHGERILYITEKDGQPTLCLARLATR